MDDFTSIFIRVLGDEVSTWTTCNLYGAGRPGILDARAQS